MDLRTNGSNGSVLCVIYLYELRMIALVEVELTIEVGRVDTYCNH